MRQGLPFLWGTNRPKIGACVRTLLGTEFGLNKLTIIVINYPGGPLKSAHSVNLMLAVRAFLW